MKLIIKYGEGGNSIEVEADTKDDIESLLVHAREILRV